MSEALADFNSKTLRRFAEQYPVIVRRYRIRYRWFRGAGFTALALWVAYSLHSCPGSISTQHLGWSDLAYFFCVQVVLLISIPLLLTSADLAEKHLNTADLISSLCSHLSSDKPYILMLRSFRSELVVENMDRVRPVEREAMRLVRGELIPTGRKYTDYIHTKVYTDNVNDFLVQCVPDFHVIHINGAKSPLMKEPLSLISTDSDWWRVFTVLASGAAVVAIVPERSASLLDEIRSVMASLRHKTILLMPPSVEDKEVSDGSWLSGATRENQWNEIRQQFPFDLPEYAAEGMILLSPETSSPRFERHPYSSGLVAAFADRNALQSLSIGEAVDQLDRMGLLYPTVSKLEQLARQLM